MFSGLDLNKNKSAIDVNFFNWVSNKKERKRGG
jgi:hypothetical protein